MKKQLLAIALILVATNVFAGWELYGTSKGHQLFYDKSSLKQSGNKVRVWNYMNFKNENRVDPTLLEVASTRALTEIDCINETYMDLSMDNYSEPHLKGNLEIMPLDNKTSYIVPNSTMAKLMKLACKK
jgi:hypothetical protein